MLFTKSHSKNHKPFPVTGPSLCGFRQRRKLMEVLPLHLCLLGRSNRGQKNPQILPNNMHMWTGGNHSITSLIVKKMCMVFNRVEILWNRTAVQLQSVGGNKKDPVHGQMVWCKYLGGKLKICRKWVLKIIVGGTSLYSGTLKGVTTFALASPSASAFSSASCVQRGTKRLRESKKLWCEQTKRPGYGNACCHQPPINIH